MTICLITGGAGFIGSHLVEALLARKAHVRVLDNLSSGHLENLAGAQSRIEFIEADVRDKTAVEKAVAGVDLVFHLAAMVSVPESMARPVDAELINTIGTLNLLNAAIAAGAHRFVLSSTCAIYGDEPTLPKVETMPSRPQSPYAISKLAAEAYCRLFHQSFGLETVILRYFNVFGPRQDPSSLYSGVISIFVDKMLRGISPSIFGDGEQTRDFVFVEDVVRVNLLASEAPEAAGKVFNIGTGHQLSINQLFETLGHILHGNLTPAYKPARSGDIRHSYADSTLARVVLGWTAQVSFEEGLRRLVDHVRATFP